MPVFSKAHTVGACVENFDASPVSFGIYKSETPEIQCIAPICEGEQATYRTNSACDTYVWIISSNGTILGGGGPADDFVMVQWNSGPAGFIQLSVNGCSGNITTGSVEAEVPVISAQQTVKGQQLVCPGAVAEYSIPNFTGTQFIWFVPPQATILSGQGTHQITVQWGEYAGSLPLLNLIEVEYENCFLGCSGTGTISVQVKQPAYIEGPIEISMNDNPVFKLKKANSPELAPAKWQIFSADSTVVWSSDNTSTQISPDWNFTQDNYFLQATPASNAATCSLVSNLPVKLLSSAAIPGIQAVQFTEFGQPVAYFTQSHTACEGESINLEMPLTPNQVCQWNNGNIGSLLTLSSANGNLLPPGTHEFTVTVTDVATGFTSVAGPFPVTVNAAPASVSISSDPPGPLCDGTEAAFTVNDPQPGLSYGWNTSQLGTTMTALAAGIYLVQATNQFGCKAKSNAIEIHNAPGVGSVPPGCFTRCAPEVICLPDMPEVADYQWFLNGEMIPTPAGTVANFNATESGDYRVQMTSVFGCISTSDVLSLTLEQPTGDIGGEVWLDLNDNGQIDPADTLLADIGVLLMDGSAVIGSSVSDVGGQFIFGEIPLSDYVLQLDLSMLPPTLKPLISSASVTLVDCGDSASVQFLLKNLCHLPVIDSVELKVCTGGSATFNGVEIDPGETLAFSFPSVTGCDSVVFVRVSEWPPVSFELFADEICPATSEGVISVEVTSGALPCLFSLDGENFQPEPDFTGISGGEHTVEVEDANGCVVSQSIDIQEKAPLEVAIENYLLPCDEQEIVIRPEVVSHAGPLQWLWFDGAENSWRPVEQAGVYKFRVTDECSTIEQTIRVGWGDDLPEDYLYVPNAFSPNGDAVNDKFRAYPAQGTDIQSFEMKIFDRWGNQLFETNESERGWDGAFRGRLLPVGVYIWFLKAEVNICGREVEIFREGDVTVLR